MSSSHGFCESREEAVRTGAVKSMPASNSGEAVRKYVYAPGLLVLPACGLMEPDLLLDWWTEPLSNEEYSRGRVAAITGGGSRVTVEGDWEVPHCYRLRRTVRREGSVVVLRLQNRPTGESTCLGMSALLRYQATIGKLEPGSYTVRVEYITGAIDEKNPVAEAVVQVD